MVLSVVLQDARAASRGGSEINIGRPPRGPSSLAVFRFPTAAQGAYRYEAFPGMQEIPIPRALRMPPIWFHDGYPYTLSSHPRNLGRHEAECSDDMM